MIPVQKAFETENFNDLEINTPDNSLIEIYF